MRLGFLAAGSYIAPNADTAVRTASVHRTDAAHACACAARSEGWIHEIKYDGYRGQIRLHGGKASILTRNGHDWTERLAEMPQAAERLPAISAVLDGELVYMRPDGTTCFDSLQDGLRIGGNGLRFVAFDLLHLDGHDLRPTPLASRKALLSHLLEGC